VDVWTIDTERGTRQRITQSPVRDAAAVWSPDGRRMAFGSERTGVFAIYLKGIDGSEREELVSASAQPQVPQDWSPDGRYLTFMREFAESGNDNWLLPLEGNRQPFPILPASPGIDNARFSPDSHWVTYYSTETGRAEVYVRRIPGPATSVRVSTAGGAAPLWRHDGRGIFYVAQGQVMSVPVTFNNNEAAADIPAPLFQLGTRRLLAVAPDDRRFLVLEQVEPAAPITLILNWKGIPH
jgi:TolB protein